MFKLTPFGENDGICVKESEDYGCGNEDHPYPNDTNEWEVNIEDFYMPNTLPEEVNTAPLAALESVAVSIRSYALHLAHYGTKIWHLNNTVARQVFVPYSLKATAKTNQAVANTREIFLACGSNCPESRQGFPAFAEHSAAHPGHNYPAQAEGQAISYFNVSIMNIP